MLDAQSLRRKDYVLLDEVISVTKSCVNLRRALYKISSVMVHVMSFSKVAIILKEDKTEQLSIFASYGLSQQEEAEENNLTDSIVMKVINSGKSVVIPQTEKNVIFPSIKEKKEKSVICVPIIFQHKTIGCLTIEKGYDITSDLDKERELLTVVTSIISQRFRSFHKLQDVKQKFELETTLLKKELKSTYSFSRLIGKSEKIRSVFEQINHVSSSNATVLIKGESGTGKELVAHAIHYNSLRADGPFIKVNCSALPENLIESELFGHEKGAFTDAIERKIGRFELANKGTLFLDEIGDLQPHLQVKLLRVIQEKLFERVGGTKSIKADVRLITATNVDLEKAIDNRSMREDFYYRINVFSIDIPPLRDRSSDIILLADHFVEKYAEENEKDITGITKEAIEILSNYNWPGNVRELENCIERAVILCSDKLIRSQDLPEAIKKKICVAEKINLTNSSLEEAVFNFERKMIEDALEKTKGNKQHAAHLLQTTNRIMGYKVSKYNIDVRSYKLS
jgi:Nif-specific regulatory protein